MPILENYHAFSGRHWETGSVANALNYQGFLAPHTNQSPSEALLMGIAGGATFGYFLFDYQGYDPILSILTRNTFDPMPTLLERLGIAQSIEQTTNSAKSETNLLNAIENGEAPLVWADMYSLPYNDLPFDDGMWAMMPIVVYGLEDGQAYIADRASQPLIISGDELQTARARIKKDKFRLMTLASPNWDKLPSAVQKGLWQSISLYTENPPKGARKNFGFEGYEHWANMLTNSRNKQSWAQFFPAGSRLYAGLTAVFHWAMLWGAGDGAERPLMADFLDEAAVILNKPALSEIAIFFRQSGNAWRALAELALPDDIEPLKEVRNLLTQNRHLFIEHGTQRLDMIRANNQRMTQIKTSITSDFPMTNHQVKAHLEALSVQVRAIASIEKQAIDQLQVVMA